MLFRRQEWCWTSCLFFLVHRCSSFFWEKLSKLEEDKSFELFGYLNCSSVPSWGAPGNGGVPQSNDYVKALGNGDSQTLQLFALSIVYIQEFGLLTLVTAKSFSSWLHPKVWTILLPILTIAVWDVRLCEKEGHLFGPGKGAYLVKIIQPCPN